MEIGIGMMGIAPSEFWAMTMPEFRAAYDGWLLITGRRHAAAAFPSRTEIDELMARFPD